MVPGYRALKASFGVREHSSVEKLGRRGDWDWEPVGVMDAASEGNRYGKKPCCSKRTGTGWAKKLR